MRKKSAPVIETAFIRDITSEGKGVADTEGKCVFIAGAIKGETVRFSRRRKRRNYDEGELIEVMESAPARVEPECEYFGICGGCSLQHIDAGVQLELKEQSLLKSLQDIAGLAPTRVLPAVSGPPFAYRRRARLGIKHVEKKGRVLVGFRERGKPYIANMLSCKTLSPALQPLIKDLSDLIGDMQAINRIPQVEVSQGDNAVSLVFRILDPLTPADREKLEVFERTRNMRVFLQTGGPDTVAALNPQDALAEMFYELSDQQLRFEFGPLDFLQVNADVNRQMIAQALELLRPDPAEKALDLFCGLGNFSLPLARQVQTVTGVEGDAAMVRRATANAGLNDVDNASFLTADLFKPEPEAPWLNSGYDLVLLDPPRAGALEVVQHMERTGARKLLYVSCHPASMARDAKILVEEKGYRLEAAGVMDMFPQTGHVESMALFLQD
ncbi:MAG: 23S rRNA (uracil(1939)-C(5))-methyltransferase RlmD [Gammaproteobacteria bacterium]